MIRHDRGIVNNGAKQPEKLEKKPPVKPQMTGENAPLFLASSVNISGRQTNTPSTDAEGTKYDELNNDEMNLMAIYIPAPEMGL